MSYPVATQGLDGSIVCAFYGFSTPDVSEKRQVPTTLDLAERARLCVNALTECTDLSYDDELYWIVDLLARLPDPGADRPRDRREACLHAHPSRQ